MEVVLNQTVKKLGYKGDVVDVKRGYFRNFLLPMGLADEANVKRLKLAEIRKSKIVMEKQQVMENAKDVLEKLKGFALSVKVKANEKGKLFAAISENDISTLFLEQAKLALDPQYIKMDTIKELGEHKIIVRFGDGMEEVVRVTVESE